MSMAWGRCEATAGVETAAIGEPLSVSATTSWSGMNGTPQVLAAKRLTGFGQVVHIAAYSSANLQRTVT